MQEDSLLKQYLKIKEKHKEVIVFFRVGDFYEMFFEDAKIASSILKIALTSKELKKNHKIPMAGVPYHSATSYIQKLLDAGYKVAICEQKDSSLDNKKRKGLIEREVTRIITPGTCIMTEEIIVENVYLSCIYQDKISPKITKNKQEIVGLASVDLSTGELRIIQLDKYSVLNELSKIQPKEVLLLEDTDLSLIKQIKECITTTITIFDSIDKIYLADTDYVISVLEKHFPIEYIRLLLQDYRLALFAAALAILYLQDTQKSLLSHINTIKTYSSSEFMQLDRTTIRNLELISPIFVDETTKKASLFGILDKTITAMGRRLLKDWILHPLLDPSKINKRQEAISELIEKKDILNSIRDVLKGVVDLERLCARLDLGIITPLELINLKYSLKQLLRLKELMSSSGLKASMLVEICSNISCMTYIIELIETAISEDGCIKEGYNKELDNIRREVGEAKSWIKNLQYQEIKRTKINSLKVGYNKIFGYYIEVTRPNLKYIPQDYIRKQTLSNAERFITPELKEKEAILLHANQRILELESYIFSDIKQKIINNIKDIQEQAKLVSTLDVLSSLALVCIENDYNKALVNHSNIISIKDGRHPVVEALNTSQFIPNDVILDDQNNVLILTGPNMAGKSTYIRQVGIIVIMAQVFGYVAAKEATIGVVDRVFARVGAGDVIYQGKSTFMVEMLETANILHNATDRSLVILDEIGRGTSTYDGISIAWAVIEYILKKTRSKTLFATHYHELIELEKYYKGVKNYSMAVVEESGKGKDKNIIFLYKVRRGGVLKSYGIEVAKLAGLPRYVISSAYNILSTLESCKKLNGQQQLIFPEELINNNKDNLHTQEFALQEKNINQIIERLNSLDVDNISPLEALQELYSLKKLAE